MTSKPKHRGVLWAALLGLGCGCLPLVAGCVVHTTAAPEQRRHRSPSTRRGPRAEPPIPRTTPAAAIAPGSTQATRPASAARLPREEPARSRLAPVELAPGAGTGRPPDFNPGAPAAYWIWQGPRGGWRLRTTSARLGHAFRGHIAGTTGAVTDVHPSRNELRDRVWRTREGWAFDFKTAGHADGFTFVVQGNGCARFDLQLDGPHVKRVFVGKAQVSPPHAHFIVCPKGASAHRPAARTP